jgi:GTP-binding protein HflX
LIRPEQATDLARLSAELGRQLGLVLSRRGEVVQVVAGSPESLPSPDISRLRRGRTRLAGYSLLHTSFSPGCSVWDRDQLARQRWDLIASLEINRDGLPALLHAAHIDPASDAGGGLRLIEPHTPGHPPEDLARLVRSLEEELARGRDASQIAGGEGALAGERYHRPAS